MVALTPEEHDKIGGLQAQLTEALTSWDSSDRRDADFARLTSFVDNLVDAKQEFLDRHAAVRRATWSRLGGWILLAVAVVLLVVLLFAGWSAWWLVVPGVALLVGISLLAVGGKRAHDT
jgi:nitrate/nitrite-specific signal transduction histidine kinase